MRQQKPIDPALRRYLDEQAAAATSTASQSNEERIETARALILQALAKRTSIPGLPNGVKSHEIALSQTLAGHLYTPSSSTAPLPLLIYLHGGGWVTGSVATHAPFCQLLSEAAGIMIMSVDYRLSPEHPYPAALGDTLTAIHWAAKHAKEQGADKKRLALGGDSAGANLAAVIANRLSIKGEKHLLSALLLLYPVTDHPSAGHPSYKENATGYGLEAGRMRWFWEQYAPGVSPDDTDISPLRLGQVLALPPTLVATAEYDVLRDEGIAYAEKLEAAGVAVTHLHAPDMSHNFPVHPGTVARFPQSDTALTQMAEWLRKTLIQEASL